MPQGNLSMALFTCTDDALNDVADLAATLTLRQADDGPLVSQLTQKEEHAQRWLEECGLPRLQLEHIGARIAVSWQF